MSNGVAKIEARARSASNINALIIRNAAVYASETRKLTSIESNLEVFKINFPKLYKFITSVL